MNTETQKDLSLSSKSVKELLDFIDSSVGLRIHQDSIEFTVDEKQGLPIISYFLGIRNHIKSLIEKEHDTTI